MDLRGILDSIDGSREDIAKMMCEMVSIPSISPAAGGNGEAERADFLMTCLDGFDSIERVDVPDKSDSKILRSNILARKNGKDKGTVWIIAHIDTVPAGNLDDWKTEPFKGVYRDGRVYGRGTEDNGQSVISSIFATKFIEKGKLEGKSIGIALVADEEMASEYGVVYLIDHGYFSADDIFLVPDWGSPEGRYIEVNEKSLIWLQFEVTGRSVHASTPDKGVNAFKVGTALITDLVNTFNKKFGYEDPLFMPPRSSFEPTKASATVLNVNTIPGSWSFCMDIRVVPKYNVDEVYEVAKEVVAKHIKSTNAYIEVREIQRHISGGPSSQESDTYKALCSAVESVTRHRPKAVAVGGATCANFFRLKGYDAYVWECGGGTLHGPNEYVELDNLITDAKVFATLFYNICVNRWNGDNVN